MRKFTLLVGLVLLYGCGSDDGAVDGKNSNPTVSDQKSKDASKSAGKIAKRKSGSRADKSDSPSPAQPLIEQAVGQMQRGRLQDAIQTLSQAISIDPDSAEAHVQRGSAYTAIGQNANALADLSTAVRLSPEDARVQNARGFFLLSQGQFPAAIKNLSEAIRLDPKFALAIGNRGVSYLASGDLDRAIDDLSEAVLLNPKYTDAWINRGFAYFRQKKYKPALSDFNKALELSPKNVNAFNNRGLLFFKTEEYDKAIADFSRSIEIDPNNAKHYQHRREIYLKLEQFDEARQDAAKLEWLAKLVELNHRISVLPGDALRYLDRARHLADGDELQLAVNDYSTALQLKPELTIVFVKRAAVRLQQGKYDEAISDCNKALRIEPLSEAYSVRGDAYLKKADYDKAIKDFTIAKRYDSTVAKAYLLRSKSMKIKGDEEQAAADLKHAIDLDPSLQTADEN